VAEHDVTLWRPWGVRFWRILDWCRVVADQRFPIVHRDSRPRSWTVPAATAAVVVMWASAFVVIRGVGRFFSLEALAVGRLTVGSVVLVVLALRARRPLPRGRTLGMVVVYGLLWFAGYTVALNAAEQDLDAGTAALLVRLAPVLVAVLAGLFMGEGFPRALVAGILVAFGGVVVIAFGGSGGHSDGFGIALGLVCPVLYASAVLLQKVALRSTDALSATCIGCVAGTMSLLPFAPEAIEQVRRAPAGAIAGMVYLGLFPTAAAFALWAYALSRTDAGRMASASLAVPAITVMLSWALLSELPTMLALVGGGICLIGVTISRRSS
jgi:drug/metabolite transporter (DMT)-like permease